MPLCCWGGVTPIAQGNLLHFDAEVEEEEEDGDGVRVERLVRIKVGIVKDEGKATRKNIMKKGEHKALGEKGKTSRKKIKGQSQPHQCCCHR
ncbi:hypothetical protein VZT92_016929 [Zoarces viviparus]|uniref:Uncharacterized protein n=1 Tax=Zoarces viviparus TaxID=48416 RepID=A0AAW1EQ83_ZOAVI